MTSALDKQRIHSTKIIMYCN